MVKMQGRDYIRFRRCRKFSQPGTDARGACPRLIPKTAHRPDREADLARVGLRLYRPPP